MSVHSFKSRWWLAATVSFALAFSADAATDPVIKCQILKLKAGSKKTTDQAKCYQKAFAKNVPVEPECLTKAQTKFLAAMQKANAVGPCLGDALDAAVDECVGLYVDAVQPTTTTTSTTDTTTTTTTTMDPNGPVMRWTFDNTLANSGLLAGYDLTAPAGNSYGTGKFNEAAVLGAGQYLDVAGMKATLGTYSDVTIAFWLREPGTISGQFVVNVRNASTAPYGGIGVGATSSSATLCVSSTTNAFLGGSCLGFTMPSANAWHHWIVRYDGSGTGSGQGGATEIYVDDVLVSTRSNDASNNPVFSNGIPDLMYVGAPNVQLDDVRVYNKTFTRAEQCTSIMQGAWNGANCTLP